MKDPTEKPSCIEGPCLEKEKVSLLDLIMQRVIDIECCPDEDVKFMNGYLVENVNKERDKTCWRSLSGVSKPTEMHKSAPTKKTDTAIIDKLLDKDMSEAVNKTTIITRNINKINNSNSYHFQPSGKLFINGYSRETNERVQKILQKIHKDLEEIVNKEMSKKSSVDLVMEKIQAKLKQGEQSKKSEKNNRSNIRKKVDSDFKGDNDCERDSLISSIENSLDELKKLKRNQKVRKSLKSGSTSFKSSRQVKFDCTDDDDDDDDYDDYEEYDDDDDLKIPKYSLPTTLEHKLREIEEIIERDERKYLSYKASSQKVKTNTQFTPPKIQQEKTENKVTSENVEQYVKESKCERLKKRLKRKKKEPKEGPRIKPLARGSKKFIDKTNYVLMHKDKREKNANKPKLIIPNQPKLGKVTHMTSNLIKGVNYKLRSVK